MLLETFYVRTKSVAYSAYSGWFQTSNLIGRESYRIADIHCKSTKTFNKTYPSTLRVFLIKLCKLLGTIVVSNTQVGTGPVIKPSLLATHSAIIKS